MPLEPWVRILLVAALPVVELRGAIPLGAHLGVPVPEATLLAIAGNMAPIPVLYYALLPVVHRLKRTRAFRRIVERYLARSTRKAEVIRRYGIWGLVLFVATPLPGTGAWSGCLLALLLGYPLRLTLLSLTLGTIGAGIIVGLLTSLARA